VTLAEFNGLDRAAFVAAVAGVFEHSPWVAEGVADARPFASVDALHTAMVRVVDAAGADRQLALIRAHPELAGKAMVRRELTADSAGEQAGAGLTQCSPAEFALLQELNARYNVKFGFPFILAVKGRDRAAIIGEFVRRVEADRATEFAECLAQIGRISRLRLAALLEA
jgi:2-oxo-4-hydroxy-4-carboxy-5-ureidoimidazoline decarboxylase